VRGAAADDPRPKLRAIVTIGRPGVRERHLAGVEEIRRPLAVLVGPVVGPSLDEANLAIGSSLSRAARTQPAAPAPSTATSYLDDLVGMGEEPTEPEDPHVDRPARLLGEERRQHLPRPCHVVCVGRVEQLREAHVELGHPE
jgi:hypothetical protein